MNIGAPAARNWLINLEQTWNSDYVAFLDDDVTMQEDWLARLLTVAEADPRCGVVGGKIIEPGSPKRIQYLYRYVAIASRQLLKLSLPSPISQFDNGLYNFVRQTRSVMGCMHLFRTAALRDAPTFDIRFSPSQVDDLDHDLQLGLKGWNAWYCGSATCVHRQCSGIAIDGTPAQGDVGNVLGNDMKLFMKYAGRLDELAKLDNLSLTPLVQAEQ